MDLSVLWQLHYGLYAISADDNGRPTGCIANAITQVTADDPIMVVSLNKQNYTTGVIRRNGCFAISICSEETSPKAISQLGFFSGRDHNKFDGLQFRLTEDNIPLLEEHCTGYLICDVLSMLDAETHVIFTVRVRDTQKGVAATPMSYSYYHNVIKGKAPKNAPTYRKEEPTASVGGVAYVCDVCGYVHEGDINDEPDDYVCPLCKVDKSHFKKRG